MSIRNDIKKNRSIKTIKGHGVMAAVRFDEDTKHMIVFDVLTHESTVGTRGERMRAFLSDDGYERAERIESRGDISIIRYYQVRKGDIIYKPRRAKRLNNLIEI